MNYIILRNTTDDGLEPSTYRATICCTTNCANPSVGEPSTLSVGLFLGNETHHANSKREGCGGAQCPHRAPPPYKKVVKSP